MERCSCVQLTWPPLVRRVARFPGLLLQHFREVACSHLEALQQRPSQPLDGFGEDEQAIAVAALMQLLVC